MTDCKAQSNGDETGGRHLAIPALGFWLVFLVLTIIPASNAQPAHRSAHPSEDIEWTWEVRPPKPNEALPNVLLIGDSISRNYYPEVQRQLDGVANVYLFAASTSVGDPRLKVQLREFCRMEGVPFAVIHFNNGMHGWEYSEESYHKAFLAFVRTVRGLSPGASLVWASTTPVKADSTGGATNSRVDARNAIAFSTIRKLHIRLDDQHDLMMQHSDAYQDDVHFNDRGSALQGRQAADVIHKLLDARP
jgi:hypothetical protein